MRTTDDPRESEESTDVPGPYERVAAALKVAALAIGPAALLWTVFSFVSIDPYPWEVIVGGALLWATAVAGSGVIARWLTLGAGAFLYRAATAPLFAAGLALTFQFAVLAVAGNGRPYAGAAVTVLCIGFLCLYWSLASTFLVRDGDTTRRRRQWKLRDSAVSLFLFGLYGAALRWLIGWFEVIGEDAATILAGTATFAGIFLIAFTVDLACRLAARSRFRWPLALIACILSLAIGAWALSTLLARGSSDSTPVMIAFVTAVYLPLSATLAGLTEWRPLLPAVRRLDERLRSRRMNADATDERQASPAPASAEE